MGMGGKLKVLWLNFCVAASLRVSMFVFAICISGTSGFKMSHHLRLHCSGSTLVTALIVMRKMCCVSDSPSVSAKWVAGAPGRVFRPISVCPVSEFHVRTIHTS